MKLEKAIYQAPEMSEGNLLELIDKYSSMLRIEARHRLEELHKEDTLANAILKEYDLIQDKKSNLTKSQREQIVGFVGMCIIQMTHGESK